MNRKAHDALVKARTHLLIKEPFYGCLALHLNLVEADPRWCDTAAVDGINMYYSPDFVLKLSEQELTGLCAHEVSHCSYQHMTRRGTRDQLRWNIAADYVINSDLLKAGFTLPKGGLRDPKYDGMSTEEVYERLPPTPKGKGNGNGQGQGQGAQGPSGQGPVNDPGNCGGVIDAGGPGNKAAAEQVARDWEAVTRMAANIAKNANAGRLPGFLERLVKQLKAPKVSWREMTRQFIDGNMIKDYSWNRPNRRFIARGLYLPGFVPDAMHHLVMIGDVSGSITNEVMTSYVSEMAGALNEGICDKLTVIYCDAKVQQVDEYVPGDEVTAKTVGGGGTDFRPAFDWVAENAADASCIVYLTDMLPNSWAIAEPEPPVLWAAYLPEGMLANIKPPFGSVIHIDSA